MDSARTSDLTDSVFGSLTVLGPAPRTPRRQKQVALPLRLRERNCRATRQPPEERQRAFMPRVLREAPGLVRGRAEKSGPLVSLGLAGHPGWHHDGPVGVTRSCRPRILVW